MKLPKVFIVLIALLSLAFVSNAEAHGPRVRLGVYVGAPVWGPAWGPVWYPPPYYYPPQVVVVPPAQPPVYIEQQQESAPPVDKQQYWYYCASAKGYYPYIKECPAGWEKVLPQPEK